MALPRILDVEEFIVWVGRQEAKYEFFPMDEIYEDVEFEPEPGE